MFGGLSPVHGENIIKSRIIRKVHKQIYCTFFVTVSGGGGEGAKKKKKRLWLENGAVLHSSRTRGSEFHSFCWELISFTTVSLYLLGIAFIFDSKDTSEEVSFPGNFLTWKYNLRHFKGEKETLDPLGRILSHYPLKTTAFSRVCETEEYWRKEKKLKAYPGAKSMHLETKATFGDRFV